jgi:hypothetical protein
VIVIKIALNFEDIFNYKIEMRLFSSLILVNCYEIIKF